MGCEIAPGAETPPRPDAAPDPPPPSGGRLWTDARKQWAELVRGPRDGSELMTAGYQLALKHVSRRLDNLLENGTDLSWQLGVEAAQAEVQELKKATRD